MGETITVGELIEKLKAIDLSEDDREPVVEFDFGDARPTGYIASWRGVYSEMALGYEAYDYAYDGKPTISELISNLESQIGEQRTGWKGGQYTINSNSPLWVANSGSGSHTAIVDVIRPLWSIVIVTKNLEIEEEGND
jgi:hypothetical protein